MSLITRKHVWVLKVLWLSLIYMTLWSKNGDIIQLRKCINRETNIVILNTNLFLHPTESIIFNPSLSLTFASINETHKGKKWKKKKNQTAHRLVFVNRRSNRVIGFRAISFLALLLTLSCCLFMSVSVSIAFVLSVCLGMSLFLSLPLPLYLSLPPSLCPSD